jgi:electron transfer flavoprotein beta subunit
MNNIVICIKHIQNIGINYFDVYALEEGVRLKEQIKHNSKVLVITMGPKCAENTLRTAIAIGADEAYLLTDDKFFKGSDAIATSYILSTAIALLAGQYKIIICGSRTSDSGTGQVGPAVATMLNIPHISYIRKIDSTKHGNIIVERVLNNKCETIISSCPVLLTVVKGVYPPRVVSIKSKLLAQKAVVKTFNAFDLNIDTNKIGLNGSPTKIALMSSNYHNKSNMLKNSKQQFTGSARDIVSNFIKQFNK